MILMARRTFNMIAVIRQQINIYRHIKLDHQSIYRIIILEEKSFAGF